MSRIELGVQALLESDAMTPDSEDTPSGYYVDAENVEYLVRTVLDATDSELRRQIAIDIQAAPPYHVTRDYNPVDAAYDNAARIAKGEV